MEYITTRINFVSKQDGIPLNPIHSLVNSKGDVLLEDI